MISSLGRGGIVNLDEARKAAEAEFEALDTDRDGTLGAAELSSGHGRALRAY